MAWTVGPDRRSSVIESPPNSAPGTDVPIQPPPAQEGARVRLQSLTRQSGALAVGALATQVAQLVLLMVLTRLVLKPQLGAYQQLNLLYSIVTPLLVAGIPAALLYFVPRSAEPGEIRLWVGDAYLLLGAMGAATSVALLVGHTLVAEALGNAALSQVLVVYAPFPFLAFVAAVMPAALVAARRASLAATLNALSGLLTLVSVVTAALIGRDATHMAAGLVVGQLSAGLISTVAVSRTIGISIRRDRVVSGSLALLRYGFPLALTGLAGMFAFQFDRLVVSRDFTPALYAVYAVGAVELPLSVIVQQAVNAVLVPAMTRHYAAGDLPGLAALWKRAIRRTSLVLLPMFVFFMLTAPATVRILYGGAYHESAVVFRVYLMLVPLRVATYGIITQAIGRTRVNLSASFVLLALNAVLVLALVGPLGLPGPAVATVLATFATAGYYLFRLRAILGLKVRTLFPARLIAANLLLSILAGIPVGLLLALGLHGLLQLVAATAVYVPSYLALLLVAKRLDPAEIALGRRIFDSLLRPFPRQLRARLTHGST
jgi:O-antigen/teichoic acid export membrane protein